MKTFKQATYALFTTVLLVSNYNCSSSKQVAFQPETSLKVDQVIFQEWYAGLKVGGTGYNIFLPSLVHNEDIKVENVYFRNLTGKLVEKKGRYSAVLKNPSLFYTWEYPEKPADYPFDLAPNECVIGYQENGQTKYHKIVNVNEKAGTYYENGHPSLYEPQSFPVLATVDED
ncbi:MAG TPA: hypothetical protein VKZ98_04955 [Aquaticitalea sp.]|nr:hypothetical protein [Aquaticitalea sp.]